LPNALQALAAQGLIERFPFTDRKGIAHVAYMPFDRDFLETALLDSCKRAATRWATWEANRLRQHLEDGEIERTTAQFQEHCYNLINYLDTTRPREPRRIH